jgi:transcriptional regulator with XRE-family HTH domain
MRADARAFPAEGIETKLARNLVAARAATGLTQHELARGADVSRATIAQLETGVSDPKLSTVVQLAEALGVSALLLLLGVREVRVLADQLSSRLQTSPAALLLNAELVTLRRLVGSGMLKDRIAAARVGAAAARAVGLPAPAVVGAAIGAPIEPGTGTAVGALLGLLMGPTSGVLDVADVPAAIAARERRPGVAQGSGGGTATDGF